MPSESDRIIKDNMNIRSIYPDGDGFGAGDITVQRYDECQDTSACVCPTDLRNVYVLRLASDVVISGACPITYPAGDYPVVYGSGCIWYFDGKSGAEDLKIRMRYDVDSWKVFFAPASGFTCGVEYGVVVAQCPGPEGAITARIAEVGGATGDAAISLTVRTDGQYFQGDGVGTSIYLQDSLLSGNVTCGCESAYTTPVAGGLVSDSADFQLGNESKSLAVWFGLEDLLSNQAILSIWGQAESAQAFRLMYEAHTFMAATGGVITTDGDYKVHTFLGDAIFTPTIGTDPTYGSQIEYLLLGGGAGSGGSVSGDGGSGGGGAGGLRADTINISDGAYPIVIGGGGLGGTGTARGANGANSTFNGLTSLGGGGGGSGSNAASNNAGAVGGSGGGAGWRDGAFVSGGAGTVDQGYAGGDFDDTLNQGNQGAGGGGADGVGEDGAATVGAGGPGISSSISGAPVTYATGGRGGEGADPNPIDGDPNTGDGGRGLYAAVAGTGDGGSGIVIIRYKFQ